MTVTADAPSQGPAPRRSNSPARIAVRSVGEVMITLGVIMLLLVVYQLYWTNIQANRAQGAIKSDLRASWSSGKPIDSNAIGIMYIERLGKKWEKPLVEGVDLDNLARGVGHFPGNAMPGQVGNFAVAGHRATHGEPFANMDRVRKGDRVIVETRNRWFVYRTTIDPKLVAPSAGEVVLPVPEQPGIEPTEKLLTMVTCHPRWGSSKRMIIYGKLVKTYKKPGALPPELAYTQKKA